MVIELIFRCLCVYFVVLLIMRIMGKREIGQLSLFDFVVLLLIADIAVMVIDHEESYLYFIPIVLLALVQKAFAMLSLRIPKLRKLLDGKPSYIIVDGKLNIQEMKKQKYNIDDLIVQMRLKNIRSISEIEYLILETNGEVSIFPKENINQGTTNSSSSNLLTNESSSETLNENNHNISPFPVIVSGEIVYENVELLKLDKKWIENKLKKKHLSISDVLYANYENGDLFIAQCCNRQYK